MRKLFSSKPKAPKQPISSSPHEVRAHRIHRVRAHSRPQELAATPIHQQHAVYHYMAPPPHSIRRSSSEGERWEVVQPNDPSQIPTQHQTPNSPSHNSSFVSLPPGASPPIPSPNGARSPSPFSISSHTGLRDREPQSRKKAPMAAPVALRILGALDPAQSAATKPGPEERSITTPNHSDGGHREREKDPPEKKERRGFWSRSDRDKDKER
ncbi:hypothetical protein C0995_006471, partial [Termitomyces sp. Mi166